MPSCYAAAASFARHVKRERARHARQPCGAPKKMASVATPRLRYVEQMSGDGEWLRGWRGAPMARLKIYACNDDDYFRR